MAETPNYRAVRIGMILDAPYPEDGRVTKEAIALQAAGHEVFLLCVRRPGEPRRETVLGIRVVRLRRGLSLFAKTAWDSLAALLWRHPVFARSLSGFVRDHGLECLHVHDLPLAGTVARGAARAGVPWVLDLHENFPAGLQIWNVHKTRWIVRLKNALLMSYGRWLRYEGRMVARATAVIAVVEEMRRRLVEVHGVPAEKVAIVTNSEWRDFFERFETVEAVRAAYPGDFLVLYLGYYGPHRGVDTVIRAMPSVLRAVPRARFVVVGRGTFRDNLERLALELGVEDAVEFRGLVPYAEVGSWMRRADVNVVPHLRNEHTDHTVPHKLFQSMLSGRPTIVSSAPPLARIAAETGGALVFMAGDPESLAEAITRAHANPGEMHDLTGRAVAATRDGGYNWDTDQAHLTRLYSGLAGETGPRA